MAERRASAWPLTVLRRALAGAALIAATAAGAAAPDFTGVWQAIDPPAMLRTVDGKAPPLLPSAAAAYAATAAKAARGDRSWDPSSYVCRPPGEPRIMTEAMPFEIFQTKDQLLFGYQWNRLNRFVALDKPAKVLTESYLGTSAGHFEGDALVIEAEGFNDRFFLDRSGLPHSADLKLTETFRLDASGDRLTVRIRLEDPKSFARPWETLLRFRKLSGRRIQEDICTMREKLVPAELQFYDPK